MGSAFDLSGQRILITGAAGGIGAATARACAALGAELLLVDRHETRSLAKELRESGAKAESFVCDVASRADVEAVAASTGPVDALVLAAGICPWDDWQDPGWDEAFDEVIAINLHGPIHFARAYLPGMIGRRRGEWSWSARSPGAAAG
jgi:NAD(P)-dependent dehydrogenase (short-subunit alcohol dehydrogenase family)